MKKITVLKSDAMTAKISNFGAELTSILDSDNKERLWQGDSASWTGQAPLLWPICGCLTDDKYTFKGQTYKMESHGFGRNREFLIEYADDKKVVYILESDEKSRKIYPFDYQLRVSYELEDNKINITYTVNNKSDDYMYFSIGSHEGYVCKGSTSDYCVTFEIDEPLENALLNGPFLNGKSEPVKQNGAQLWLNDDDFKAHDTLIFRDIKSKRVMLKGKHSAKTVTVEYPGFDNLLLWKLPGAEYLCIEPWCGLPDYDGIVSDISEKPGIIKLEKNGVFKRTHSIIIN